MKDEKDEGAALEFPEQINVTCRLGDQTVRFYLRMISVLEENQYMQRFAKLPADEQERTMAEYAIMVAGLCSWSVKPPTGQVDGERERPLGKGSAAEVIQAAFGEYSIQRERVLNSVLLRFRSGLAPETGFF